LGLGSGLGLGLGWVQCFTCNVPDHLVQMSQESRKHYTMAQIARLGITDVDLKNQRFALLL
jgi:hypothetical protein